MERFSAVQMCAMTHFIAALFHMVHGIDVDWIKDCPRTCNCHISHFTDLSISKSLNEIQKKPVKDYFENYESSGATTQHYSRIDDAEEQNMASHLEQPLLHTAICVLQEGVTTDEFFTALPLDIQVLTVLQGPEKIPISIETTHLTKFNDLQIFEIFGFHGEKPFDSKNQTKLLFKVDFPDPIPTLKYLHLDNVRLKENSESSNNIIVNDVSDENFYLRVEDEDINEQLIPSDWERQEVAPQNFKTDINRMSNAEEKHEDDLQVLSRAFTLAHRNKRQIKNTTGARLVFVEPPNEIIPYEVFKKMYEKKRAFMFAGLKNLIYLQISNSDLRDIDWQWFDDLKDLEILSLEKNQIEYIPEFTFHALKKLKILILSNNNIQSLASTSFAGLFSLEILDLSQNNLMELSDISFPPFPKLKAIDLSDNPIKFIGGNTFEVLNTTRKLYLGGQNENVRIQTNAFTGLSTLQSLEISGIQLQVLERDFFRGMSDLLNLRLQGSIDYLTFDAFAEIPLIKVIILRNCSILALSMDTFYGLYDLEVIDLSHNKLKRLPPKLFDQQSLLKEIILSGNKLTDIPANLFSGLTPKLIHLQDNPWLCTCKMKNWHLLPINQIKRKKDKSCKVYDSKSSRCNLQRENESEYTYSRSVEPRCKSPSKFKDWTVSKMLRKGLSCIDTSTDEKKSKRLHIKHKYEQYLRQKYGGKLMSAASMNEDIQNNVEKD